MNFLEETKRAIEESGHKPVDIVFIGSEDSGHACSWQQFEALADAEYYNGFGASAVATDLIVVFSDGQKMWRGEYDGSEWWEYSSPFKMPEESHPIVSLFAGDDNVGWVDLREVNPPKEK